jgi:hypothetical protein
MQRSGFEIKYMEGNHSDVTTKKLELPPKLVNHRPDVFGTNSIGAICIGEAKTKSDLTTERTRTQFIDFKRIVFEDSKNLFIIGIPSNSKHDLLRILSGLGIRPGSQLVVLEVPEQFLMKDAEV